MSDVTVTLKHEEAESLQQLLRGMDIAEGTRGNIALLVEDAMREAVALEPEAEPRYVGEHGEHNPNTLGKPRDRA